MPDIFFHLLIIGLQDANILIKKFEQSLGRNYLWISLPIVFLLLFLFLFSELSSSI